MTVSTLSMMAEGLAWNTKKKSSVGSSTGVVGGKSLLGDGKKKSKARRTSSKSSKKTKKEKQQTLRLTPTVNVIQDYVERVLNESQVLQQQQSPQQLVTSCSRDALNIGRMVGEGSFSQVCSVRRKGHSSKGHVIKQLHPHLFTVNISTALTNDPLHIQETRERVQSAQQALDQAAADLTLEALYLSSLSHPHIVTVSAISNSATDAFLCIEQVPQTLESRILQWRNTNRPSNIRRTIQLRYATQLADALQYLHTNRIVLRDLKPDNIGIDKHNDIKLFDLGLSRELPPHDQAVVTKDTTSMMMESRGADGRRRGSTMTGMASSARFSVCSRDSVTSCHSMEYSMVVPTTIDDECQYHMTQVGTMRYCAGEILLGQPYNAKCDIYSYAIVLYEIMTLQRAFPNIDMNSEDSQQEHIAKVCVGGKRPGLSLYQLPPSVERVIRKCWQRNPFKRWNSSQLYLAMSNAHKEIIEQQVHNIVLAED